ncbi:MAG TPA: T9SS type A sorting domain-containing protein [Candidatus Cloacimonadota bacterium]|nr:T9SS type A sorting domain-containing protein [Candidatus Cloacimonadota bacterium]HPT71728.1 T9SS type A sorting domain-containing protein [Candidatus Cloacimonadota bacterium]
MKQMMLLLMLVLLSIVLSAQDLVPWSNIRNSAYTFQNTMNFRCESAAALFSELTFSYKAGNSWTEVPMTNISNLTYEASVPYTVGQDFHYTMKARRDSLVWLTPAKVTTTSFPPNINELSYIGSDPTGDSNLPAVTNLDITGTYFGYSDTKFYAALESVSGTYPTMTGLTAFNAYICGIVNPEASLADSTIFAMVYVNVPLFYSSGIYKLKLSLTDFQFTRVGSIQSSVSNGKLFMACNISDLTAESTFGAWPNISNALVFDAATFQAGLSGTSLVPTIADWGPYATLSFDDYYVPAFTNHLPVISEPIVTPAGNQQTVSITYSDEDANYPLIAEVMLDNNEIYQLSTLLPIFSDPVVFTCSIPATGWQNGVIRFSDNNSDYVSWSITSTPNHDQTAAIEPTLIISPNPWKSDQANLKIKFMNQNHGKATISLYNIRGQRVAEISSIDSKTGLNEVAWNGKDNDGKKVPAGIYFCRLSTSSETKTVKFLVLE